MPNLRKFPMPISSRRSLLTAAFLFLTVLPLNAATAGMFSKVPDNLDWSLTRRSEDGRYDITIRPDIDPVPVGRIHTWTVYIVSKGGTEPTASNVMIDGGMPQHGHGLPTRPKVTVQLLDGGYRVEGMKFNMTGWWTLTVHISGAAPDEATFNLRL
jgi:hypothetical protein